MDVDPRCCQAQSTAQVQPSPASAFQYRARIFSDPIGNQHTDYLLPNPRLDLSKLMRVLAKLSR